ncbi:MAG: DegT/DnrJ/EryC1/StrS family aminotransferase [Acidiferrobacterales bacterium]|nr:DegT/DnrJ/EryC1/StrS family aminotransferase [Acidiferrobacterales bacterium]
MPFIDLKSQYAAHQAALQNAVVSVLDHGQYIMGNEVNELESELASYIGVKHVLACSSGTDALILPLMTMGLTSQDAIFTTPFTFFASAESISLAGATPVFVDIDPQTYNIDPDSLRQKIQSVLKEGKLNPRGVIPVDLFGISADYNAIQAIADEFELFVLEDAAQSFGAQYKDRKACSMGDFAATSFYPAKPLGCYGDGGAVFTNDSELYETLVSLRVHGQGKSGDKYDNVRIGMNARMDTIQAAVLLEKLKFYDDEIIKRNDVAARYNKQLSDKVVTPKVPEDQGSVWAQYSIQVDDREKLKADLAEVGIPTAVFYPIPIHLSTAYQYLGYKAGDFPVSESVSKRIISLPMHPYLDEKMIDQICDAVNTSVA